VNAKKWKHIVAGILGVFIVSACSFNSNKQPQNTPQVDLYAGTKGNSHAFLGANVPFGYLKIGPQTRGNADGVGYNYNDSIITGFILSYTGEGEQSLTIGHEDDIRFFPSTQYEHEAKFVHNFEAVKPGYYSIYMHDIDIAVELTVTPHTAFQRYFFPPKDSVQVTIGRPLTVINDSVFTGQTETLHFVVQFSRPMKEIVKGNTRETQLLFDATEEEMLYVKVAISPESIEDANAKLANELPDWDFERMANMANRVWSEYLN